MNRSQSPGAPRGRGGRRKRGGILSSGSRGSSNPVPDDLDLMEIDEVARTMNDRIESLDSDFLGEGSESEASSAEVEDEVPESDDEHDQDPIAGPSKRKYGTRGRGGRGQGRGKRFGA